MDTNGNVLNWFEIPVTDYSRAKKFYENIFGIQMMDQEMGPFKMGFFPYDPGSGKLSGAICHGEGYTPSMTGPVIYFNANPDMQTVLDKVEKAGGKVLMPKTQITPEIGYMAFLADSEGNKVALHSQN
jgi:uncharacterized protein